MGKVVREACPGILLCQKDWEPKSSDEINLDEYLCTGGYLAFTWSTGSVAEEYDP